MLKIIALFSFASGLLIIGYAGLKLWDVKHSEQQAVAEAKQFLSIVQDSDNSEALIPITDMDASSTELSFQNGQIIGILEIPLINKELPIVEGTDDDALKRGVGHYTGSVYPGQQDQILLSGHRDTVFTGLDKLQNGDTITVTMQHGAFTYVVVGTEIVDEDDTTIIRSTAPDELLTISTCYPFRYIGNAPKRYIVYAEPESKVDLLTHH